MFATDYPMEDMTKASGFLQGLDISEDQREAIMSRNAKMLFKL